MSTFSDNLRKYRKQIGINQTVLAEKIGTTQQVYARWERGDTQPKIKHLILLAQVFGVLIDDLVMADSWIRYPENKPETDGKFTVWVERGKTEFMADISYINGEFTIANPQDIRFYRPIPQKPRR